MTKTYKNLMKRAYDDYEKSNDYYLWGVYKNYSAEKEEAFINCQRMAMRYNGVGLRICKHSTYTFSIGFRFNIEDEQYFCYITKDNTRIIRISDLV